MKIRMKHRSPLPKPLSPPANVHFVLYDRRAKILWVSNILPPYKRQQVIDQLAWFACSSDSATECMAAFAKAAATGEPQCVDAEILHLGRWRTWIFPLRKTGIAGFLGIAAPWPPGVIQLTDREREICALLGSGLTPKQVATKLGISRNTVDVHRRKAAAALGMTSNCLDTWCGVHREWL